MAPDEKMTKNIVCATPSQKLPRNMQLVH